VLSGNTEWMAHSLILEINVKSRHLVIQNGSSCPVAARYGRHERLGRLVKRVSAADGLTEGAVRR